MDVKTWQVLVGLTVMLVVYWLGVELVGVGASAVALVILIVFGGAGIVAGRYLVQQRA